MNKSRILFDELDRCVFVHDFEYNGALEDYRYNDITYSQSSVTYYSTLLTMYRDFICEWSSLSEEDKRIVRKLFDEIKRKRYIDGSFFFNVPTKDAIQGMINDKVPRKDIEMARFVYEMAEQQSYFLMEVMTFLEGNSTYSQAPFTKKTETEIAIEILRDYPDILSTSDVARIFNRSEYTIREWESKGKLINVAEDATDDKDFNSNGHKKRRMSLQFRKCDIIQDTNLRAMLVEHTR